MTRKHIFLNFTVTILKLSFLWPSNDNYDQWRLVKDASLIVSLMPCALPILAHFVLQITGDVYNMVTITENLIALICIIGMIYMTICFVKNRKLVKTLVKNLPAFTKYSKTTDIILTDKKANLYTKIFVFYGVIGNVVYMIMPYLNIEKCQQRQNNDVPCGLVTRCWFPFKFDYSPVFEIVFVHQFYTCLMVSVIILDLTMLICGFLMHITNQLKHLRGFIKRFDCSSQKIAEDVIYCVKFHTAIITYSEKTNEAFGTMMMLHITLTSLVISALGFEILIVDNFNDSLRFTLHLLGWLVLLLLICYYGQLLIDESIAVAEDIYYVPWHLAPVDVQKDIYMILMRSQKPLTLNAANIGVMSFPTFLRVISSAYSYFTLLLNIKS
ncbi:odorant receptor 49b [Tribolium castaneum]|nr:PREDICTED: odorant receptor 49b [Tribolium castaneum]|eukprot:XP_015836240.1 PREDICTED: odorant receptor 49b [Tribolium castaneum]